MTIPRLHSSAQHRAMTTAELTMAMAIGVVLLGLLLGLFISTQKASDRIILREQMFQEAMVIDDKLAALLRRAVPDERLEVPNLPASRFTAWQIEFYATGEQLQRWTIRPERQGTEAQGPMYAAAASAPATGGGVGQPEAPRPLGLGLGKFNTSIQFAYAEQYEGLAPRWNDSADRPPRVIRYTITVQDRQDRAAPVVISSALCWPALD
ncbi:MAG: hypothetical protein Kow0059_16200 [Candidatus Sumerlaeia bacterium]